MQVINRLTAVELASDNCCFFVWQLSDERI